MLKKILLSSSLFIVEMTSSSARITTDMVQSAVMPSGFTSNTYHAANIGDQSTTIRKAIGGDFIADKCIPFLKMENLYNLFVQKYANFKSDVEEHIMGFERGGFRGFGFVDELLPTLNKEMLDTEIDWLCRFNIDTEPTMANALTLIEHMRAYINDPSNTGLYDYLHHNIGFGLDIPLDELMVLVEDLGLDMDPEILEKNSRYIPGTLIVTAVLSRGAYVLCSVINSLRSIEYKDDIDETLINLFNKRAEQIFSIINDLEALFYCRDCTRGYKNDGLCPEYWEATANNDQVGLHHHIYPVSRLATEIYIALREGVTEQSIFEYLLNRADVLDSKVGTLEVDVNALKVRSNLTLGMLSRI